MSDQKAQRIQVFRNMVAADPENELANFSLGKLLFEAGEHVGAEPAIRKALELNPRLSAAIQVLGGILLATDRRDEAIQVLNDGVELAHAKGEFQPRNAMQATLRDIGVTPPDPEARDKESKTADSGGEGGPDASGCRRCGLDNPRLDRAPFNNELGAQILEKICTSCWKEWRDVSIKVINEYRLNLSTEEGSRIYDQHMMEFLGLE